MKLTTVGELIEFRVKPIIGITIIISMFSFIIISPYLFPGNCSKEKRYLKMEIIGTVDKKFYDSRNHGNESIVFSDKKGQNTVIFNNQSKRIYQFVNDGDSLFKPVGSLDIKIISNRLDTIFTIDFGCDKYPDVRSEFMKK